MEFSIRAYEDNLPMRPWPSLAGKAFCLEFNSRPGETIFFYDDKANNDTTASPPIIVLVHGLGDEADSWRHIIPLLGARGFRVLALDLPGFGRSKTIVKGRVSLKSHAETVLQLIEAVTRKDKIEGAPVFLAGNSLGALIAEAAAFKKQGSQAIKGLILIDGSIPGGPANPGLLALAKILLSRKWYRAYRNDPEGAWASLYPYYADLKKMPEADRDFLKERVMARVKSSTQEKAYFQTQRSIIWAFLFASSPYVKKVRNYSGKILLVWGDKDRIIPLSSAQEFKNLREDIKLEIIPGAGHLPQQEKPEETAKIIAEFVEREREEKAVKPKLSV